MNRSLSLCLVVVLVTAGCVGPLGGQSEPVGVVLENQEETATTFEVIVVEFPSERTVTYRNGTTATGEISQGVVNFDPGPRTITNITFSEPARTHAEYTLGPGENRTTTIEELPNQFAVVVTLSDDGNTIKSYVTANCGDMALVTLSVTAKTEEDGGLSSQYGCG